jgi:hypothetical protein
MMMQIFRASLAAAVLASMATTAAAHAAVVKVETKAYRGFADAGESGATFDVSADISVLVTRDGVPVLGLGDAIPMNGSAITLPPAFRLQTSFVAPVGPLGIGCILDPIAFTNHGNGVYTIRVVPSLDNPICRWGLGDYHYTVRIQTPQLKGAAMGVLTIPDSPSVP